VSKNNFEIISSDDNLFGQFKLTHISSSHNGAEIIFQDKSFYSENQYPPYQMRNVNRK